MNLGAGNKDLGAGNKDPRAVVIGGPAETNAPGQVRLHAFSDCFRCFFGCRVEVHYGFSVSFTGCFFATPCGSFGSLC